MSSLTLGIAKYLKLSIPTRTVAPFGSSKLYSTASSGSDNDVKSNENEELYDDFLPYKPELQIQSVHPRRGWVFRGVHKAILCGKIGQAPAQKILRSGQTVTMFTVGTGVMFDRRILGVKDLPKPAQWHRIIVHNVTLGAYAVHQLVKNSSVYVEGNIETRVYNDSRNGEVKNIPEICVRHDVMLYFHSQSSCNYFVVAIILVNCAVVAILFIYAATISFPKRGRNLLPLSLLELLY